VIANTAALNVAITRKIPRWSLPLNEAVREWNTLRLIGIYGGRAGGKSHEVAARVVERMVADPDLRCICIREVQKSLKYSVKSLIEAKIRELGVGHLFTVLDTEIRANYGNGLILFQGMQDHTADSIKSLEDFRLCWVEEAQTLSARALSLLLPTIRAEGSQIWFTWNPDSDLDPVDRLFRQEKPDDALALSVNYTDNPFCTSVARNEAKRLRRVDPDAFAHVWQGGYNTKSKAQILSGKWRIDEFTPGEDWDGPYHGADFGFSQDPTTLVKCWVHANTLYVERESYEIGLEIDDTPDRWRGDIPSSDLYRIRAENARPETISYLRRHGYSDIVPVEKGAGSVEDGLVYLRQFDEIVVHTRCKHVAEECRLYSYKVDKRTGDILRDIVDKHNHTIDAIRYAIEPLIKHYHNFLILVRN
jgi:phage terminase large subunit